MNLPDAIRLLDDTSASLETVMAHYGATMPSGDQTSRNRIVRESRNAVDSYYETQAKALPLTTPQEITEAAEAFAAQLDHYDPFATKQKRDIMLALKSATAAQALRFAYALRRAVHPGSDTRADVMLYNITRTIEGA